MSECTRNGAALERTAGDACAEWRTPRRSGTGYFGAAMEALRYTLRFRGLNREQLKQFAYAFRREILNKVRDDLCVVADPEESLEDGLILGFGEAPQPDGVGTLNDEVNLLITAKPYVNKQGDTVHGRTLAGKHIGLLFSGSWCDPCKRFMPLLAYAHNLIKQRGQELAIVFVSRCKSEQEFKEYFDTMPDDWLAVPYTEAEERRDKLTRAFGVRGIPTLAVVHSGRVLLT